MEAKKDIVERHQSKSVQNENRVHTLEDQNMLCYKS